MRINDNNDDSLSWVTLKEQGKSAFERGDYHAAISKYGLALQPDRHCPAAERQIILSNLVAARLKIGGPAQAEAAVENAKQCVALNDRWAKGHVRLASAYIALGGHSNDACNSLQRALQLDPGYPSAREMLVRELRREHANRAAGAASNSSSSSSPPQPSAPPEQFDDQDYNRSDSTASNVPQEPQPQQPQPRQRAPQNPYQDQPPLDDRISLQDRISFHYNRAKMWYFSQSDDVRTVLKVLLGLLCLYVAFGGRFGLENLGRGNRPQRGNYHSGNAYDQYYEGQRRSTTSETRRGDYSYQATTQDRDYNSYGSASSGRHRDDYSSSYYDNYSSRQSRRGNSGSFSFHMPNLFDGSLQSMMILAAIAYMCHRNGVNPMQILIFLNMMNGGGRRHHRRGMFGYGGGMGGMGGFRRRRW